MFCLIWFLSVGVCIVGVLFSRCFVSRHFDPVSSKVDKTAMDIPEVLTLPAPGEQISEGFMELSDLDYITFSFPYSVKTDN